jgi:outer membrane protein
MTRFISMLLIALLAGAAAAAQTPTSNDTPSANDAPPLLTLDEAISQAELHNRLIQIADQGVLYSNDEILAAKTQRYPHFNIQLSGSYLISAIDITIPKGVFGNIGTTPIPTERSVIQTGPKISGLSFIQVYQPLSKLYDAHLNIKLLQSGKKLSEEQLRQQKQQIKTSVKESYYSLLQSQAALQAAQESLDALKEVDRTTEEYVKEKTALPYQSAGVKAQVAQAELQLITLQDTTETQKENLNNLMGRDVRTDFRISEVPEALPEEQNIEAAQQSALSSRTEIRQAQLKIDQAVFSRRLQKAQYIPEVAVQYLYFSPFTAEGLPNNINAIGLSLKWDFWDWGYKRHLMDERTRNIEQGRLNLTETQNQVVIDLDNRWRKLREARASVKVARLAQEAEKQKLQVVLEQYKQKAVLLSAFQTEQSNMAQANAQYQQALSNFWSARSEFEKSLGED